MRRRVRILEVLIPEIAHHPLRSEFFKLVERLSEVADPFDGEEFDCVPVVDGLHREHFITYLGMVVDCWEHPDGELEIIYVNLPEVNPPPEP